MDLPIRFSHVGINVTDMKAMFDFYSKGLGFVQTDEGELMLAGKKVDVLFLSRNPREHHQVVLVSGREPGGSTSLQQLSFNCGHIASVQEHARRAKEHGATQVNPISHGNAISVYMNDPEGNNVELYTDTPWYVNQPVFQPIPGFFDKPADEIMAWVEEDTKPRRGFEPRKEWIAKMEEKMKHFL
ncbi:hypothetical protein HDU93_001231 [Gonapodya sp. JEL0774]|nr:hypothetical protein HDU93_001231 [Gonapodya sp. JEL0774]